jgi:hypothetical protein
MIPILSHNLLYANEKNREISQGTRTLDGELNLESSGYASLHDTFKLSFVLGGTEDWNRVANPRNKNRIRGFPSFKNKTLTSSLGPCRISGVGRWIATAWDGISCAENVSLTAISHINRTRNAMPPFNHKGSSV